MPPKQEPRTTREGTKYDDGEQANGEQDAAEKTVSDIATPESIIAQEWDRPEPEPTLESEYEPEPEPTPKPEVAALEPTSESDPEYGWSVAGGWTKDGVPSTGPNGEAQKQGTDAPGGGYHDASGDVVKPESTPESIIAQERDMPEPEPILTPTEISTLERAIEEEATEEAIPTIEQGMPPGEIIRAEEMAKDAGVEPTYAPGARPEEISAPKPEPEAELSEAELSEADVIARERDMPEPEPEPEPESTITATDPEYGWTVEGGWTEDGVPSTGPEGEAQKQGTDAPGGGYYDASGNVVGQETKAEPTPTEIAALERVEEEQATEVAAVEADIIAQEWDRPEPEPTPESIIAQERDMPEPKQTLNGHKAGDSFTATDRDPNSNTYGKIVRYTYSISPTTGKLVERKSYTAPRTYAPATTITTPAELEPEAESELTATEKAAQEKAEADIIAQEWDRPEPEPESEPTPEIVVIGVSPTTNEVLVKDTETGDMYYKPGTPEQIAEVGKQISELPETVGVAMPAITYTPPKGETSAKPIAGSMMGTITVPDIQAYNDKWSDKIKDGVFIGSDIEHDEYIVDNAKIIAEIAAYNTTPIDVYTFRGDTVKLNPKAIEELSQLKGKEQYNKYVELGILQAGEFVEGDTPDTWDYVPQWQLDAKAKSQEDFKQSLLDKGYSEERIAEIEKEIASGQYQAYDPATDSYKPVWREVVEQREAAGFNPTELQEIYSGDYKITDPVTGRETAVTKSAYDAFVERERILNIAQAVYPEKGKTSMTTPEMADYANSPEFLDKYASLFKPVNMLDTEYDTIKQFVKPTGFDSDAAYKAQASTATITAYVLANYGQDAVSAADYKSDDTGNAKLVVLPYGGILTKEYLDTLPSTTRDILLTSDAAGLEAYEQKVIADNKAETLGKNVYDQLVLKGSGLVESVKQALRIELQLLYQPVKKGDLKPEYKINPELMQSATMSAALTGSEFNPFLTAEEAVKINAENIVEIEKLDKAYADSVAVREEWVASHPELQPVYPGGPLQTFKDDPSIFLRPQDLSLVLGETIAGTIPYTVPLMLIAAGGAVAGPVGVAAAAAPAFALTMAVEGHGIYEDAIAEGASKEQARELMNIYGTVSAAIEVGLDVALVGTIGLAGKAIKGLSQKSADSLVRAAAKKYGWKTLTNATMVNFINQSSQEALQEITHNVAIKQVNEDQVWYEGAMDAFVAGAIGTAPFVLLPAGGQAFKLIQDTKGTSKEVKSELVEVRRLTPSDQVEVLNRVLKDTSGVSELIKDPVISREAAALEIARDAKMAEYATVELELKQTQLAISRQGIPTNAKDEEALAKLKEYEAEFTAKLDELAIPLMNAVSAFSKKLEGNISADNQQVIDDLNEMSKTILSDMSFRASEIVGLRPATEVATETMEIEKEVEKLGVETEEISKEAPKEVAATEIAIAKDTTEVNKARITALMSRWSVLKEQANKIEQKTGEYWKDTKDGKVIMDNITATLSDVVTARNKLEASIASSKETTEQDKLDAKLSAELQEAEAELRYFTKVASTKVTEPIFGRESYQSKLDELSNRVKSLTDSLIDGGVSEDKATGFVFDIFSAIKKKDIKALKDTERLLALEAGKISPDLQLSVGELGMTAEELMTQMGIDIGPKSATGQIEPTVSEEKAAEIAGMERDIDIHETERKIANGLKDKATNPDTKKVLEDHATELSRQIEQKKSALATAEKETLILPQVEIRDVTSPVRQEESLAKITSKEIAVTEEQKEAQKGAQKEKKVADIQRESEIARVVQETKESIFPDVKPKVNVTTKEGVTTTISADAFSKMTSDQVKRLFGTEILVVDAISPYAMPIPSDKTVQWLSPAQAIDAAAKIAVQPAASIQPAIAVQPATGTEAVTETQTATALQTDTATQVAAATQLATATQMQQAVAGKKILPPPPPFIPILPKGGSTNKRRKIPAGSITWDQGIFWKYIPPPWNQNKPVTLPKGVIPTGAINVKGRTPAATIQMIGKPKSKVPRDISVDLGISDIHVTNYGKKIEFTGKGLDTDVGTREPSTATGMSFGEKSSDVDTMTAGVPVSDITDIGISGTDIPISYESKETPRAKAKYVIGGKKKGSTKKGSTNKGGTGRIVKKPVYRDGESFFVSEVTGL